MWLLLACTDDAPVGRARRDDTGDPDAPRLSVSGGLLPYVEVGEPAPSDALALNNAGGPSAGPLTWTVDGDFAVDGDATSLEAGEERALALRWTGGTDADSDFGQLDEPGGHAALVRDVVSVLYRDGRAASVALGSQVLTSHSGGYAVTANVLEAGGLPVDAVHLFDSVYGAVGRSGPSPAAPGVAYARGWRPRMDGALMWRFEDLVLFTGSVYGLAWLVTRSKLFRPLRERLEPVPFLGALVRCIVCTGAWVAIAALLASPRVSLLSDSFKPHSVADAVVLVGWAPSATWALGRALGDAD